MRQPSTVRRALLAGSAVVASSVLVACTATAPSPRATSSSPGTTTAPAPQDTSGGTPNASGEASVPGGSADSCAARPDGELILATQAAADTVALVDPTVTRDSAVVAEIRVGHAPWGVAVHDATDRAFVSTAEGVAVVDLCTLERTALHPYQDPPRDTRFGEYREGGEGIAVAPDGATVYVAVNRGGSATLDVIDVASGDVEASVPVGLRPFDVLVAPDGSQAYTVDHDSFTVHVVDTGTFEAETIDVAPFGDEGGLASWEKPHYAALADDGDLLLPFQGAALVRLDPRTGRQEIVETRANSHQHGIAAFDGTDADDASRVVIVGNGAFGSATGEPNVSVLDLRTGDERVAETSRHHETVAPWTDPRDGTTRAVLSGGYTQPGAWDGATVLDLDSLESYEIEIPGRPQDVERVPAR